MSWFKTSPEDPQERPDYIRQIIGGLERYNPEAAGTLEQYLAQQCEEKFVDSGANRALLKLYQLNPDRIKDEVITNILVKAITLFPSPQFNNTMHLLPPSIAASLLSASSARDGATKSVPTSELSEAVAKLRELNSQLETAQYAKFWATLDSDDLYADLTTDIAGFEDMIRLRIAQLIGQAFREVPVSVLEAWLGLDGEAEVASFVTETCRWGAPVNGLVTVPKNPDNEARKADIREEVNVDMFARVIRRTWEETA